MRSKIREALEQGFIKLDESSEGMPHTSAKNKHACRLPTGAALNRHRRKCSVCRYPLRADIEQEFLRWRSPDVIARAYGIADHSSIYRHAHATGLYERRGHRLRLALDPLIERAAAVQVNARSVINAVYVAAHLDGSGRWMNRRPNRQTLRLKPHGDR